MGFFRTADNRPKPPCTFSAGLNVLSVLYLSLCVSIRLDPHLCIALFQLLLYVFNFSKTIDHGTYANAMLHTKKKMGAAAASAKITQKPIEKLSYYYNKNSKTFSTSIFVAMVC